MRKMSVTTTLALLLVLILGTTVAYAAFHWCPNDPVFNIDGETVTVYYALDDTDPVEVVKGPVRVKMYVSKDVEASCDDPGAGFDVQIIKKGSLDEDEAEVRVKVPTDGKFLVAVKVTGDDGSETICEGWSNKWVECEIALDD